MKSTTHVSTVLTLIFGWTISGFPQTAEVRGPVLGHVVDQGSSGVRPVFGIAGAANVGARIDFGFAVQRAVVSSYGEFVLGVRSQDGVVVAVHTSTSPVIVDEFPQLRANPDRLIVSDHGRAAGLYYAETSTVIVVTGFPAPAYVSRELDLSRFSGDLDALAISDGGDLLWSTGIGADAALYFAASSGEPRFLLDAGRRATLAFANDGHHGVVADPQRKELLVMRNIRESGTRIDRWSSRDGIDQPVGVALDGANHVLVANSSGSIVDVDIDSAMTVITDCGCSPTTIEALDTHATFRLTELHADSPMYVYDRSRQSPRIVLVPPFRNLE